MSDMEEDMRFEILGPIRVNGGRRDIPVRAELERTLLAALLLDADRTVPTGRLVNALWDSGPPRNPRSQLHSALSRLRKRLAEGGIPGDVIVTEPDGYRLRVRLDAVDLLEFRNLVAQARAAARDHRPEDARGRYRAALRLWRGPALAGTDRGRLRQAATSLDEERTQALIECIDIEFALGGGSELVGELTDLVHQHPYRERLHAALMLALYRADRQADALAAYQRIRQALVTELGQDPGPALRQLHQRILGGDPSLLPGAGQPDSPHQPLPASHSRPHQPLPASHCLPRTVDDFTGREADLAWLLELAEPADPHASTVAVIDGMPGVGKTSLAVRAAHLLAHHYPDGQLFVDLHGHSQHRPLEPATALGALLGQLGIPATQHPTDLPDRIARWRAELATRRVLVVLDNAASSSQTAPLLPASAGCLVIVTSRRRLVELDGARPRSVDTLTPDESITLLERIAGPRVSEDPETAATVAERCGRLPLALRLAAARLAHRPGWRIRDLADRLADPAAPLTELSAGDRTVGDAFALSYRDLPPASQRLFRRLGLHPRGDFDARVAAALADLPLPAARRRLAGLVDVHLVEEPVPDRYRLHDLVRVYARRLGASTDPEPDRDGAVRGLLDYYLHATVAASDRFETPTSRRNRGGPPGTSIRPDLVAGHPAQGAEWLEAERSNLVAVVRLAAARGQDQYAWRLARAMWPFLFLRCYVDDLLDTHRRGLTAAERLDHPGAIATMRNYLASAYYRVGSYQEAAEQMEHAVVWHERSGDLAGLALARKNLAAAYSMSGRVGEALRQFDLALAAADRSGVAQVLANVVANAGAGYLAAGRYSEALDHSRRGLALTRRVADEQMRAIVLGNLGVIRIRLGAPDRALRLLTAALAAKRRTGNRSGEGETLNYLGVAYRMLGRFDLAADHHQAALAVMREVGDRPGECAVHDEFGRTLRAAGDLGSALDRHQRALTTATQIPHRYGQARALDGIAACLRDADPESASRYWLRARSLYEELEVPERHEVDRHLAGLPPPSR
jgi:DNA-binding SARP family transcriptional activator/tetratricopeptide (TPR) repeat protein